MVHLKTFLFTIVFPGSVAVLFPWLVERHIGCCLIHPEEGIMRYVGVVITAAGALIYLWCAFGAFSAVGRGTPLPLDPPKELVAHGLYKYTRNPMYVGVLSVILGQAVSLASPAIALYFIAVFLVFHGFTVLYEEPTLRRKFGPAYEKYLNDVPRWIPARRHSQNPGA